MLVKLTFFLLFLISKKLGRIQYQQYLQCKTMGIFLSCLDIDLLIYFKHDTGGKTLTALKHRQILFTRVCAPVIAVVINLKLSFCDNPPGILQVYHGTTIHLTRSCLPGDDTVTELSIGMNLSC